MKFRSRPIPSFGNLTSRQRRLRCNSLVCTMKRSLRNTANGGYDLLRSAYRRSVYTSTHETFLTAAPFVPENLAIGIGVSDLSRDEEAQLRRRLGSHNDLIPRDYAMKRYTVFCGHVGGPFYGLYLTQGIGNYNRLEYPSLTQVEWHVNNRSFSALMNDVTVTCRLFEAEIAFPALNQAIEEAVRLSNGPHDPITNSQLTFCGDLISRLQLTQADLMLDAVVDLREIYNFIQEFLGQWFNYINRTRDMPEV